MHKSSSSDVRRELMRESEALEQALPRLVQIATELEGEPLREAWTAFEHALLRHLDLEEKELFPLVMPFHAEAVRELELEHEGIRALVAELGLGWDLNVAQTSTVERLAALLRSHAAHEHDALYRWVEELAPLETRRHLLGLLVDTVRADLRTGGRPTPENARFDELDEHQVRPHDQRQNR